MENSFFFTESVLFGIWIFLLGAAIGSFANLCAARIPIGISVITPPSRCDACKIPIRTLHKIPVASWIYLRGKCAYCHNRISVEYPLVELFCGTLALLLYREFGISIELFFYLIICMSLVVITLIDAKHLVIPDVITLPATVAALGFNSIMTDWEAVQAFFHSDFYGSITDIAILDSIGGMLIGGGMFFLIATFYKTLRKKEGMGMGDVKLVSMLGAALGMLEVLIVILLSSVLALLTGLLIILMRRKGMEYAIPYGPFLSLSAVVCILEERFSTYSFRKTDAFLKVDLFFNDLPHSTLAVSSAL